MIVERRRQGLGLLETRQNTLRGARRQERRAQGEPEVDGLLARGTLLRQPREGTEGLLEVPRGLVVSQPTQGLVPCLSAVCHGLVPHLASQGMVCQAFDLLRAAPSSPLVLPLGCEPVEGLDDAG